MKLEEKTCENCKHLFISGMFQSWGGTAGYCLLIQNDKSIKLKTNMYGIPEAGIESIKQLTDSCNKFEQSENLK
jgi:hypothetical protein